MLEGVQVVEAQGVLVDIVVAQTILLALLLVALAPMQSLVEVGSTVVNRQGHIQVGKERDMHQLKIKKLCKRSENVQ